MAHGHGAGHGGDGDNKYIAIFISILALFLAIALPWVLLVQRANPDFLWFFFVREHFLQPCNSWRRGR